MKRYLKTIIAILLIALAAFAMYLWNEKGREKAELAQAELLAAAEAEEKRDPYEDIYNSGKSFFPIPKNWVSTVSSKLNVGNTVKIYYKQVTVNEETEEDLDYEIVLFDKKDYQEYEAQYFGTYKVASVSDKEIEIICNLNDFTSMENLVKDEENKLIFVMGVSND